MLQCRPPPKRLRRSPSRGVHGGPAEPDPRGPLGAVFFRRDDSPRTWRTGMALFDPSAYIRDHIRTVPHWPAPGVQFRDITPLLANPRVFRVLIDQFVHRYFDERPDAVAGLDARGF